MRTVLLVAGLLAELGAAAVCSAADVDFTPPDGGYHVRFPAPPTLQTDTAYPYYMAKFDDVTYYVMPGDDDCVGAESYEEHDRRFDIFRDGMARNLSGKVVEDVNIRLENRYDGRFVRMNFRLNEFPGPALYRARCFCIGDHIYQIVTFGPAAKMDEPRVTRFLESFSARN